MAKFGLSQSIRRVEDPRLLKGGGRYTDDVAVAGQAQGYVLRSPHAHAKIVSIDTAAAAGDARACSASGPGRTWRRPASGTCPASRR